ncbi:MAG: gliding motility-associated C-terminal domain-containing protein [Flavobacteriales bacterium]|nr:gliding motility-associated C-terminal domain-containing protein [Flavobacteriales bacterium]
MKKVFLLFPFLIFTTLFCTAQIDYQVRIDELYSAADALDGSGNEDPTWKVEFVDNGGGGLNATGCIAATIPTGTWWSGVPSQGITVPFQWPQVINSSATLFTTAMECWEEDGSAISCDNDACVFTTCGLLNSDDGHAPAGVGNGSTGNTGDINFTNDAPCVENQYELNIDGDNVNGTAANYKARISVYWSPSGGVDPGSIAGDQVVCANGDPLAFTSLDDGEPANFPAHFTYQWQEDVGCSGTWTDIGSATSATYDAPIGITQSTCFRRLVRSINCSDVISNSLTVTVTPTSTAPSSINSTETVLCGAGLIDLNVVGGSLAGTDVWEWYDGDPNGTGVSIGTNSPLVSYAINSTTTFHVRAEGSCGSTASASLLVTVNTPSIDPTSVSSTGTSVCIGSSIDLTVNGGSLGTGAVWAWYDTDPSIGLPTSIYTNASPTYNSVSPLVNTTYYVRAEGCDTTNAVSVAITVNELSSNPTSVAATSSLFCSGGNTDLTVQGGPLGNGVAWQWYEGGCGSGLPINTGSTINVSPTITTTYYVRSEGECDTSTCLNVTITVDQFSTDPLSITPSSANICLGQSAVLTIDGGSLGTAANWEWYQGSCGGGYIGSGNTIGVTPGVTTTYFARAEGVCGNTICLSQTITVGVGAADPTSASLSVNNICPGDTTELSVTGPVLDPGYTWVWYTGACGAVPVGVGTNLDVMPTVTTTYYVRAVGTCGQTNCVSVTVDVLSAAIMADGITSDNNYFCTGDSAILEVYGGTIVAGSDWTWYENSCGGLPIGTGATITVYPSTNTAYFVRAEGGACGNTGCVNILINVLDAYAYMPPFDTLCGMGYPFDLTNGVPEGGVYSGTGIANGIFDPILAGIGTHSVTYTFTEANGCIAIATGEIVIDSNDIVASVSIVPEICAEGGITLVGSTYGGSGFYIYEWSNGYIGNPLQYADTGTYSVIVVDGSNCVSIIPDIEVNEDVACIEMPNSFTPNNDGTNDMWNLDLSSYTNGSIQVYSKWGNLVWESSGTMLSWDGTHNGQILPAGTYYYILDIDNGTLTQNGPVTIVK